MICCEQSAERLCSSRFSCIIFLHKSSEKLLVTIVTTIDYLCNLRFYHRNMTAADIIDILDLLIHNEDTMDVRKSFSKFDNEKCTATLIKCLLVILSLQQLLHIRFGNYCYNIWAIVLLLIFQKRFPNLRPLCFACNC